MSKRFCSALVVSILVRSIQLASSAEMPPLIDRPNADSGPTEISVGMWVVDISSIDSAQQTFTAEIAVVLRWKDAHTGNGVVRYPLEQMITGGVRQISMKSLSAYDRQSDRQSFSVDYNLWPCFSSLIN